MAFKGFDKNEYGAKISKHVCDSCGVEFTVCPGTERFDNCLGTSCPSYDEKYDVDKMLSEGLELNCEPIH